MSSSDQNKLSKKKQKTLKYLPIICEKDSLKIANELKICLTSVKINIPRVPFSVIRKCPKDERKKKQLELLNKQPPEQIEAYYEALRLRRSLFLGINALCKGIEENSVSCCILEANVSSRMLVNHATELANQNNVPIIVIENLKDIMKNSIGFASLAIGFHKSIESDKSSIFHNICSQIINISTIVNQKVNKSKQEADIEEQNSALAANQFSNNLTVPKIKPTTDDKTKPLKETSSSSSSVDNINKNQEIKQDIYQYRKSTNIRVFKPTIGRPIITSTTTNSNNDDNIKISGIINTDDKDEEEDDTDNELLTVEFIKTNQRYYQPVTVKRVKNNPTKKKKSKTTIKK